MQAMSPGLAILASISLLRWCEQGAIKRFFMKRRFLNTSRMEAEYFSSRRTIIGKGIPPTPRHEDTSSRKRRLSGCSSWMKALTITRSGPQSSGVRDRHSDTINFAAIAEAAPHEKCITYRTKPLPFHIAHTADGPKAQRQQQIIASPSLHAGSPTAASWPDPT